MHGNYHKGYEIGLGSPWWRYLLTIWSLFLFAAIIWDFVTNNGLAGLIGPIAAIYTAGLAIYSAEKEFERWNDYYNERHPGEVYVIVWTVIIFGIFIAQAVLKKPYVMPPEVVATYIAVISILAITKKSKGYYHHKHNERRSP